MAILIWKQSLTIVILVGVVLHNSPGIKAADFDLSANSIGRQFVTGLGLNSNFVFTTGNKYPPIADDVSFWCITPDDSKFEQVYANDTSSTLATLIDLKLPVNFMIHGYLDGFHGGFMKTGFIGWMDNGGRQWADVSQSNVCAVDWSRLATYEYVLTALKHTRKVAEHIVDFVKVLEKNGADISKMSIVGHSLGGQTAGFVGAGLDGKLAAIFGLDPAGPAFSFPFNDSPASRLDPTDAQYVQCVHTARLTLGVNYKCGHGDFYPDGGYITSGCYGPICAHLRAVQLFKSALDRTHVFMGTHCVDDSTAILYRYQCSTIRDVLGIYTNKIMGSFYLATAPYEPYCINCLAVVTTEDMALQPPKIKPERRRPQSDQVPILPAPMAQQPSTPIASNILPQASSSLPTLPTLPTLSILPALPSLPMDLTLPKMPFKSVPAILSSVPSPSVHLMTYAHPLPSQSSSSLIASPPPGTNIPNMISMLSKLPFSNSNSGPQPAQIPMPPPPAIISISTPAVYNENLLREHSQMPQPAQTPEFAPLTVIPDASSQKANVPSPGSSNASMPLNDEDDPLDLST